MDCHSFIESGVQPDTLVVHNVRIDDDDDDYWWLFELKPRVDFKVVTWLIEHAAAKTQRDVHVLLNSKLPLQTSEK